MHSVVVGVGVVIIVFVLCWCVGVLVFSSFPVYRPQLYYDPTARVHRGPPPVTRALLLVYPFRHGAESCDYPYLCSFSRGCSTRRR